MTTLIIPDIHQNLEFAEAAVAKAGADDTLVFLGDYFDSRTPRWADDASFLSMVDFLLEWTAKPNTIFLLGNHDIPYMTSVPPHYPRYIVPGFDYQRVERHLSTISRIPWDTFRLFHYESGHLISHAGLHKSFWQPSVGISRNLQILEALSEEVLARVNECNQDIFRPGISRGGHVRYPGPTWQCWSEFEDSLPVPQIVGHTPGALPRAKGRSWNIDCTQTHVAWLIDGKFSTEPAIR